MVCEEQGNRRRHACPFHGWVYDSSGTLCAIPNPEAFPGVAEQRPGLNEVTVVERHGLIWRLPQGWGEAELVESLGGLDDEPEAYGVDRYVLAQLGPELGHPDGYGAGRGLRRVTTGASRVQDPTAN